MKTEKRIIERDLMSNEEFEDYLKDNLSTNLNLHTFEAVNKFKSVRRAIRRGHVSPDGVIYPKRPFNNAKHGKNSINDKKKRIYEQLKKHKLEKES